MLEIIEIYTWRPADADETWECRKSEDGAYRVAYTDEKGRKGEFSVHLLSLEGKRFLDFLPLDPPATLNSFYTDHLVPTHTFARVLAIEPSLRLSILDEQWLTKHLERHPGALAHKIVCGQIVVTASTRELQRFLLAHLETAAAFRPTLELRRAS